MSENPHSSQVAPIDEYRVLWTTQKKQKLKKWHDGFLRFHKFNKRLLVYDDARHLVADMYLRGRDTIDEGDDLEFENHLVTVEDFKGTVVQDLTPIFTSTVKRKQQIQVGNSLINMETPNQANRHGPWGPTSRNTTPAPHQRPMAAAAKFPPQTPVQRRPTNAVISLQQSIRTNNNIKHPYLYQGRPLAQAQSLPARIEPLQRLGTISNHNTPIQQLRQSGPQRLDAATSSARPPLNTLGDPPSPNRRLNRPSKQQTLSKNPQNHQSSLLAPPHVNRGTPNLNRFSDAVRPLKPPLPHSRPSNIFSKPASVNKSTPDVVLDTDSDDELFGSPPDFHVSASPPLAQQTDREPAPTLKRSLDAFKNPDNDPRAFKPPSKRKAMNFPQKPSSVAVVSNKDTGEGSNPNILQPLPNHKSTTAPLRNPQVAAVDSNSITGSGDESEKEKVPFDPLANAGTLLLGTTAKRKRNKLLCQRPSPVAPKEPSTGNKERESAAKKPRKEPAPKPPSPPVVIERAPEELATADDAPIPPPPAVKKGLSAFKFQPPKKVYQSRDDDKGKGIVDDAQYRIEEEEDTIEYQKEHDIGPWSSEAFDLFDWRPPSMREGGK